MTKGDWAVSTVSELQALPRGFQLLSPNVKLASCIIIEYRRIQILSRWSSNICKPSYIFFFSLTACMNNQGT